MTNEMTAKEAVRELKILREEYWDDDGYGHETQQYDDTITAIDMAINALGKDIPKEPIQPKDKVRYGMGYSYYDYYCPTCEDYQFPEPKGDSLKEEGHITRCYNCGQLIRWEVKADDE